jgi:RDD family protein
MEVVDWDAGRITTRDQVEVARPMTGAQLRDAYLEAVRSSTLGLARFRGSSLVLGPIVLFRFGKPSVTRSAVDWPIQGGLLARAPGGRWRIQSSGGRVEASVTGYRPSLPRPLYSVSHLQVHLLFTRLFLLGLRGRDPLPPAVASPPDRIRAASVDAALCLTLTRLTGRRSWRRLLAIAAVYHVACWSTSGQTLGGLVLRQRVASVDGSRLIPAQSLLRFVLLPISWIAWRPIHDEVAGTVVITE